MLDTAHPSPVRTRTSRRRPALIAVLALSLMAGAYAGWRVWTRPTPVHLAVADTLTGPSATEARAIYGAQIYLDQVNAEGGIDGHPIELVYFDDKKSPAEAIRNVHAIADSDCVAVFAHSFSVVAVPAGPEYKAEHIPALTGVALADAITIDNPWFFRSNTPNSANARWIANYVNQVLRDKASLFIRAADIDLVTALDVFGRSFEPGYVAGSGGVVPRLWHFETAPEQAQASMAAVVDQLAEQPEPRIIVVGASSDQAVELLKLMRRHGIRSTVVFGTASAIDALAVLAKEPEERDTPGFFTDDVYVPAEVMFDSTGDQGQRFAAAYAARFGELPSADEASGDNMIRLMVTAMRRAHLSFDPAQKVQDRERVRAALAAINSPAVAVQGMEWPLYFNDNRDMPRAQRMGLYQGGILASAPLQLVDERNPELVDTNAEIAAGHMLQINNDFYWLQRVVLSGIDVARINRVDVRDSSFNAEFYLWMRYGGDDDDAPTHIRFPDLRAAGAFDPAKPMTKGHRGSLNYRLYRVVGDFKADYDLHDYPFDTQQLLIRFVNTEQPRAQVIYAVDRQGLRLPGEGADAPATRGAFGDMQLWRPEGVRHFVDTFSIDSTLGDPTMFGETNRLEFGGFDAAVVVRRDYAAFMVKSLIPLFLLVLVVFATLFFPPSLNKERTTIPVTGILTSAVLLIAINSQLPAIGYTVALEYIFYTFFGLCLAAMVSGFLNERLRGHGAAKAHLLAIIDPTIKAIYVTVVAVVIGIFWWKYGRT